MATCLGSTCQVDEDQLKDVSESAKDFALYNGFSIRAPQQPDDGAILVEYTPFTLFPSVVPRRVFQEAVDTMTLFSRLIHRAAHDHDFLTAALRSVLSADDFTKRLWDIYIRVRDEGRCQPLSLGMFRNDFMIDGQGAGPGELKHVELNTIAAASGSLIGTLTDLHRFTLDMVGARYDEDQIPQNNSNDHLASGMLKAWNLYGNSKAVVLYVVPPQEKNVYDQRSLEFKVHSLDRRVHALRRTLLEIHETGTLTSDMRLMIDSREVAVVYYRSGYGPQNYPSQKEWDARLLLERSLAIKCPSIQYQLAGTKKIQQELARPGAVERFFTDKDAIQRVRKTFTKLYSLDHDADGAKGVTAALSDPSRYVMKPQREGGGNNIYGDDIRRFLESSMASDDRNAYILMERIFPESQKNYLIKRGSSLVISDVVVELGIYGVYIGSAEEEVLNVMCGHMAKTKTLGLDEGGLCMGLSCLDTPFLVD